MSLSSIPNFPSPLSTFKIRPTLFLRLRAAKHAEDFDRPKTKNSVTNFRVRHGFKNLPDSSSLLVNGKSVREPKNLETRERNKNIETSKRRIMKNRNEGLVVSEIERSKDEKKSPEEYEKSYNPESRDDVNKAGSDESHVSSNRPSLSGADVFQALQKAALEREKKSRKRRDKREVTLEKKEGLDQKPKYLEDVRPIIIKPEWAAKIESIEKRVKELKETLELS
eukprot:TRINITY_DN4172_c0_g1_i2.p1 TRINITY_DN4172_c0_g1~~TRINITY_DN4172_c0_g1_i2.p1  ORF type:complete len:224 (+),score=41.68 TRINITY_DN4172_c0_g1_i2:158-829(+)